MSHKQYFLDPTYSYLSNKRSPTIILSGKNIPGPTQLLETLRLFIFEKNYGKIGWKSNKVAIFKSFFI